MGNWRIVKQKVLLKPLLAPCLVLVIGFALLVSWQIANTRDHLAAESKQFENRVDRLVSEVHDTILEHKHLLQGLRGLFAVSESVTRREFHDYAKLVDLRNQYSAVLAVSWYRQVANDDVDAFETFIRQDTSTPSFWLPDFSIRPSSNNPLRHVLTYVEPMAEHQSVLGYDLSTNDKRARAISLAKSSGEFVATEPVSMIGARGNGFLLLLPVYSTLRHLDTEHRNATYEGSVGAVFVWDSLMGQSSQHTFDSVRIYDVTESMPLDTHHEWTDVLTEDPFYMTGGDEVSSDFIAYRPLEVGGRQWAFEVSMSHQTLAGLNGAHSHWIVFVFGGFAIILAALWIHAIVNSRDRAKQQAAELTKELVAANRNLERSNQELNQFAFVASHDLQAPIRRIEMATMLLGEALGDARNDAVNKYIHYIDESSKRMQRLVIDLLAYARADKSGISLNPVDLTLVAEKVIDELSPTIKETQATVVFKPLPVIMGDVDQMERLFSNLITNAINYRHNERLPCIEITCQEKGSDVYIRVKDNGIGIDPNHQSKVFEPFSRLHNYDEIAGTGLGLGICKQIVENHGGEIYIEKSSPAGTTFTFNLQARFVQKLPIAA